MLTQRVEDKIGFIELDINQENTLAPASINELIKKCEELDKLQSVNVLFISSARDKYFCNGLNPLAVKEEGLDICFSAIVNMITRLYSIKKPMVACINGYALAGGAVLGILADYRFANAALKYAFNEILLGLTVPQILFDIINNTVGSFHAKHLCQTGKVVRAKEALSMGLIDGIFEDDRLYSKSLHFAKRLANFSSLSICYIKKLSRKKIFESFEKMNTLEEKNIFEECLRQPIVKETFKKLLQSSQKRS